MALIVIGLPVLIGAFMAQSLLQFREKKLEIEARMRPRRPRNMPLVHMNSKTRVRVLEQIVTDGGAQTAAQIEALREITPSGERSRKSGVTA